jgi:toxin FitB
MILLDTNVVSALMAQDSGVVAWLDTQPAESIWLTSLTVFETEFGLALLPAGRRRKALETAFTALLAEDLDGRVVAFDAAAASAAARLAAERRRLGRPVEMRDTQIAGIAIVRRATLATRNLRHFEGLPTPVVSPWG